MKCTKCNSDKPVSLSIGDSAVSLASWCPDCGFTWTKVAAEEIATLQSQLAASQNRERILREGLEKYADENNWYEREDFAEDGALMGFTWEHHLNGPIQAQATLKKAEEAKCTGK